MVADVGDGTVSVFIPINSVAVPLSYSHTEKMPVWPILFIALKGFRRD